MLTLRLIFPWGRFYAHPWGQNPSRITEAEWPPSPWRLLRAVAAAWFHANPGREASNELIQTLETLGRELPTFILPKVSFSRTVHYQPYFKKDKEANSRAKYQLARHENHFAAVGGDVLIRWQLSGVDETAARTVRLVMNSVVGRISYFGRADSVCEVEVINSKDDNQPATQVAMQANKPCRQIGSVFRDVFCPNPADFHATDLWQRRTDNAIADVARKHLVQELLDAPQPLPDGAVWFSYRMPDGWPERWIVRHAQPIKRKVASARIMARFLEFSLQCRIPVPTKFTVSVAELFRSAAINNHRLPSFALSGHDHPEGKVNGHCHAFYLPTPNESGHYLSRLRVWCPYGFTQQELDAIMGVGALRWAGGRFPIRPVLLRVESELPETSKSCFWQSVTPFVPPRYWYRKKHAERRVREPDSPESQLRASLKDNGVDATDAQVSRIEETNWDWNVCKVHLPKSTRASSAEPDHRIGVGLRIEFPTPTSLGLPAFGHSSHFGLGQFSSGPCL